MSWFKSWFNSPYYHLLYQHRDELEAEQFLVRLVDHLHPSQGSRILDLACGKGRHSVFLNSIGFEVTGIDLSEESIQHCLQFENNNLSFFVHDMRRLFRVNDFDLVLNLFTSFGYFETETENIAAMSNATFALKKKGHLVIDFFNSNFIEKHLVATETKVIGDIHFNITRSIKNRFLVKEIRFTNENEHFHFIEKVQTLQLHDFEKYLLPCGMKITEIFGDYDLQNFDSENSPRLILIAQKI